MDDIKRPRRPTTPRNPNMRNELSLPRPMHGRPANHATKPAVHAGARPTTAADTQPVESAPAPRKRRSKGKIIALILGLLLLVAAATAAIAYNRYQSNLAAVDAKDETTRVIRVDQGMTTRDIAELLHTRELIRDPEAFSWYVRLEGISLQAGTYQLSRSNTVQEIAKHIASGKTDTISIMFYPGSTLRDMTRRDKEPKTDVKTVLLRAGYSSDEIEAAFKKTYTHPLFKDKPADADLEGYIMADTFYFDASSTVEQILTHTFDVYYKQIQDNNLEAKLKEKGFNLYQGITLASIIQKEVNNEPEQRQVAQVFLKRLKDGISLGSDPTFIYAARKTGAEERPDLQSPYNTRLVHGLPPGPIANPGMTALKSIVNPAAGDYLFFVAGEDGKTYFSHTQAEHERNIAEHCKTLCQ